jgi:hypothetical protein
MNVDSRVERKFAIGLTNNDFFEKILKLNCFHNPYKNRTVNSIYFDTNDYSFLRANIDGIGIRKKIRVRWYNNDLNNFFFEEKSKNNFLVTKKIKKINFLFNKKIFQDSFNKYFNSEINNNFIDSNYKIVLKTNYERSYWLSNDKKIRATIDTNLKTSPGYDLVRNIYLPDSILEFKYLPKYENYFRNFFKEIRSGLRAVKYSKYVRSFFELNNSGLIK